MLCNLGLAGFILSSEVGRGQPAAAGLAFAWTTSHTQQSQHGCGITQKVSVPMAVLTLWEHAALCLP